MLNDFELHVLFVPVSVGSADDVLGVKIRGFDVAQRNPRVAASQDTVQMLLDHFGKGEIGFEPGPTQVFDPSGEELSRPRLGTVRPQMTETFFEQMSFGQLLGEGQQVVQRLPSFAANMSLA